MAIICPECGRNLYRFIEKCYCGCDIKAQSIRIVSNVKLEEKIDTILTWSKKVTKKMKSEGIIGDENDRISYYHNCSTGEQSSKLSDVMTERGFRLINRKHKAIFGIYVGVDEEKELLTFIKAILTTTIPEKGEIRHWNEEVRFFVNKNREQFNPITEWRQTDAGYVERPVVKDRYIKHRYRKIGTAMDIIKGFYINEISEDDFSDFREVIKDFIPESGIASLSGNNMLHINNPETFSEYMIKYKELKEKSGPKQSKIDEFTAVELKNVEKPEVINKATTDVKTYSYLARNVDTFATIETVPGFEKTCVLRTFSSIPSTNTIKEGYRLYIQGKQVYTCKPREDGKFIYCPMYMNPKNWDFALSEFDSSVAKGTILEYFTSVIEEIPYGLRSKAIWAFIKWPILEQIYKAGYTKLMTWIFLNSIKSSPVEVLEKTFGTLSEGKNLYQRLGVNKFQLKYINDNIGCLRSFRTEYYESSIFGAVAFVKNILDAENITRRYYRHNNKPVLKNIADLDNETFVSYADAFNQLYDNAKFPTDDLDKPLIFSYDEVYSDPEKREWYTVPSKILNLQSILKVLRNFYSPQTSINMIKPLVEISEKKIASEYVDYRGNIRTQYFDPYNLYFDYLFMAYEMNDNVNFRPQFSTPEQIKYMHDLVQEAINISRDKIKYENFNRRKPNWQKWEYFDEKEDYIVVAPKAPNDLANEGTALHHCVKGYIGRVAEGITNIMFIRKASAPDVPFFTVEVSNYGDIEQIHGFGNRNLETEPDLIPFVNKWVAKKNLKKNHFNKVR